MRVSSWPLLLICSFSIALLSASCRGQAKEARSPVYTPIATVKDLMDAIVDPSADVVWNAVATVMTSSGTEQRAPRTAEEWTEVRHGAVRLVEAANLLLMPGRHIAQPGERSETPGIELEPEEMEALVDQDRDAWDRRVRALHEVSVDVLQAVDARDPQRLFDVGERLDVACENCHVQYWYPNETIPAFPSELRLKDGGLRPARGASERLAGTDGR